MSEEPKTYLVEASYPLEAFVRRRIEASDAASAIAKAKQQEAESGEFFGDELEYDEDTRGPVRFVLAYQDRIEEKVDSSSEPPTLHQLLALWGRKEALVEAVLNARTSLRDLANHWPVRELHEPPEATIERLIGALAALGVDTEGLEDGPKESEEPEEGEEPGSPAAAF